MKQAAISFALTLLLVLTGYLVVQSPYSTRALSAQDDSNACCGQTEQPLPRELDFPYYSLQNGFGSTLNLVSDSPAPLDFTISVHSRSGQTLVAPKMTIQPQAKLPIDMATLLKGLGADTSGDFAEGSVSLNFVGTIMPLVGQMTTANPALRLVHETEMVENDPGRTDIPEMLNGLWWNISGGRDAQFMVTNMSSRRASADVFLDYAGERHPSVELDFRPHETRMISVIQLLADLNATPSQVPEGGITIIQRELAPTLIAQGKVLDPATGFSTTLSFPDPLRERANSLHASGLPVGKPTQDSPFAGTGYFVPHVVLRNLTGTVQSATITVEYPKGLAWKSTEKPGGTSVPNLHTVPAASSTTADSNKSNGGGEAADKILPADLTGQFTLAPLSVAAYSTLDYSLDAVMSQLPLPVPYCSIRIQYSGATGAMVAQVSSVDIRREMVIDAPVANEGDGWHGSGANPWHLDKETESILFLTDEGDKAARVGFSITAGGVHYYLTTLSLAPHETRAIDLRKLRDLQQPDYKRNKIPAGSGDGSVYWTRLDNVPVMGRLAIIERHKGMAYSYDCCPCTCPPNFAGTGVSQDPPNVPPILPGQTCQHYATASFRDCNYVYTYYDVTTRSSWSSSLTTVATVNGTGLVTGVSGGTPTISALYSDYTWKWSAIEGACVDTPHSYSGGATCPVVVPTFLKAISNTTEQETCSPSGVTCARLLNYQVLDQNQNAIQIGGMTIRESYSTGSSSCTVTVSDNGTWTTNSSGNMSPYVDRIRVCCPSGTNCFTDLYQTFSVNNNPVVIINGTQTGTRNYIVLTCTGGAGSPCPTVTPSP